MSSFRSNVVREPVAAATLLAGVLLGIVVMLFHPTGHDLLHGNRALEVHRNQVVHGTAVVALFLQCFGTLAVMRRLQRCHVGLAELAASAQFVACGAGCLAAIASGFVAPGLLLLGSQEPPPELWRLNHHVNQVFAGLFVAASAVAMTAFSLAGWSGRLPKWVCAFGCIVAPLGAALVLSGHLRLGIHGFFAVVLGQAVWFVGVAFPLWRRVPVG